MSLIIKKLNMPKEGCKDCLLVKRGNVFDICPLLKREVNGNVERGGKPYNCPLIELPDHGDLIDRDKLKHGFCVECTLYPDNCLGENCDWGSIYHIEHAPAVIPAERSE